MRKTRNLFEARFAIIGLLSALILMATAMLPAALPQDGPPGTVTGATFKVIGAHFVEEYQGINEKFETNDAAKFRGVILTVEVKKYPDEVLTLFAPDFSLHYYYGDSFDVVQCYGISGFSTARDTDRPMTFFGAGYGKAATGMATTKGKKVYVDLFFRDLEPTISNLYLFMGTPVGKPFASGGWE